MSAWISFATIARKEVVRFMRIWTQTLLPPVITQSLYFLIFGGIIGSQIREIPITEIINDSGRTTVPYMSFIVPGIVMMSVITSSFSNVVSSFFGAKFQRNIEELLVSPTPNWAIILGYCSGGVLRGLLVGLIVFLVSFFFVRPTVFNPFLLFSFVFLTASTFSLGGFLNGIFAKKFDDVSIFPVFVLTPLTYLGGIFYSVNSLPPFWQAVSKFNPIVYMIDGFRYSFYGFADVNVYLSLGFLTILTGVLYAICHFLVARGYGLRT
jgi:ABC-2 type transport system permease protein